MGKQNIKRACRGRQEKKSVISQRAGACRYDTTYYSITPIGVRDVVVRCRDKVDWFRYMPEWKGRITVRGKKCSNEHMERYLRMTTAAIIDSRKHRRKTSPIHVTSKSRYQVKNGLLLADIVQRAKEYAEQYRMSTPLNSHIRDTINFYNANEIKSKLSAVSTDADEAADVLFGRYSGLLETCFESLTLHVAPQSGMSWPQGN